MEKYRPEMKKFYYDPTKYKTYLEQLGISIRQCGSDVDHKGENQKHEERQFFSRCKSQRVSTEKGSSS